MGVVEGVERRKAGVEVGRRGVSVGDELHTPDDVAPPQRAVVGVIIAGVLVGVMERGEVGERVPEKVLDCVSNLGVEV